MQALCEKKFSPIKENGRKFGAQTKHPKVPREKTSQDKIVPRHKVPGTKRTKGQNVPSTKCPEGQNVPH